MPTWTAAPADLPVLDIEAAVRDALRHHRDPAALAANPLARGEAMDSRAAHVRTPIAVATDRALPGQGHDAALRHLLELTFLGEEDPPMRLLLRDLAISRATYYRWLDEALGRIARVHVKLAHRARPSSYSARLRTMTSHPMVTLLDWMHVIP